MTDVDEPVAGACADSLETTELLNGAKSGSKEHLDGLLSQMHAYLAWVANRQSSPALRAKAGASDIVQQSYVAAIEHFDGFRGDTPAELRAWLRQIVVNEAHRVERRFGTEKRNVYREQGIHGQHETGQPVIQPVDQDYTPATTAIAGEQSKVMAAAIAGLPDEYQQVIRLRNWEKKSLVEIAEIMGKTENAVSKMWVRALVKLEAELNIMKNRETHPTEPRLAELLLQLDEFLDSPAGTGDPSAADLSSLDVADRELFARAKYALNRIHQFQKVSSQDASTDTERDDAAPTLGHPSAVDAPTEANVTNASHFGNYEIVRELGRGGFGVVLLARDPALDRMVALKIPRVETLLSENSTQRLEQEARSLALLAHPSIVPIYEFGRVGPIPFIASQYCDGESLSSWFDQQNKSVRQHSAARIIARLANAVQHAHQRGVVHRDLKPANILIDLGSAPSSNGDSAGSVSADNNTDSSASNPPNAAAQLDSADFAERLRITDFGLARLLVQNADLTHTGAVVGTPAYMAPEQLSESPDSPIGPACDIYSLGTMLYELLVGRTPFKSDTHLATLRKLESQPAAFPRSTGRALDADLKAICLKCLEKSPQLRYASAGDLAADLERWLSGLPVTARRISSLTRFSRWVKRNPIVAGALLFAFAALATGLLVAINKQQQLSEQLQETERQRVRAVRHLERTERSIDMMLHDVAHQLSHVPGLDWLRTWILENALEMRQELLDEEPEDATVALRTIDILCDICATQMNLGRFEEGIQTAHRTLAVINRSESLVDRQTLQSRRAIAKTEMATGLLKTGKLDQARQEAQDAIACLENVQSTAELLWLVQACRQLAVIEQSSGRFPEAREAMTRALDLLESEHAEKVDREKLLRSKAQILISLGIYQRVAGQTNEAQASYTAVIEAARELGETKSGFLEHRKLLGTASFNRANLLTAQKEYAAAEQDYSTTVKIYEKLVDDFPDHFDFVRMLSVALGGKALTLTRLQRFDEALEAYARSDQLLQKSSFGETTEGRLALAKNHNNRGTLFVEYQKDLQKAIDSYSQALAILDELLQSSPHNYGYLNSQALAFERRGEAWYALADWQKAETDFARGVEIRSLQLRQRPRSPSVLGALEDLTRMLVDVRLRQGNPRQTQAAIDHYLKTAPPTSQPARTITEMLVQIANNTSEDLDKPGLDLLIDLIVRYANESVQKSELDAADISSFDLPDSLATHPKMLQLRATSGGTDQ